MARSRAVAWAAALAMLVPVYLHGFDDALALQSRLIEIFERRWDNVVRVKAGSREPGESGETKWTLRVGSGFFASADGHILATFRVVEDAERLSYEYLGRTYEARLIGADPVTNLALLEAVERPDEIDFVPIGDAGMPPIGSLVLSVSCALEFDPAPSMGMVNGHEGQFGSRVFPTEYIRASIPANPGEGGSPVFDLEGRFIGVLIASLPEVNSSYIIPGRAVARVRDALLESSEVRYGWIGIGVERRATDGNGLGLFIESLEQAGPAARAGLQVGDRLLSLDGESIRDVADLRERFFFSRIGESLSITVKRGRDVLTYVVRVEESPEE